MQLSPIVVGEGATNSNCAELDGIRPYGGSGRRQQQSRNPSARLSFKIRGVI